MKAIKIDMKNSYKLGMDEVPGLREAMVIAFQPVLDAIKSKVYWDKTLNFQDLEYKSRDGFIAHSHNCGGLEIDLLVPECEQPDFDFLEFGVYEPSSLDLTEQQQDDERESESGDGFLDARLRIIFKFEGIENNKLQFYINVCGGNGDAPYFRLHAMPDLYEASFECSSLESIKNKTAKHVKGILKLIK